MQDLSPSVTVCAFCEGSREEHVYQLVVMSFYYT